MSETLRSLRQRNLLTVLALPVLLAGCDAEVIEEATELLTAGGEIRLRDTLRPITPGPRVLVFALDGVGVEALEEALDQGRLPRFRGALEAPGAGSPPWALRTVTTVLPSITLAAWTSLFTGSPPGESGIPGNEWFDRRTGRFHAPAPVSVSGNADALSSLTDGLMGEWILTPTVFERADVRSHVSMLHVHRGADILSVPGAEDLAGALAAFAQGVDEEEGVDRELYADLDAASADGTVSALESHGVPRLQVVYFPGVDLFTHAASRPMEDQQRYLQEVVDPAMAKVLEAYRDAGALEETWIVVVADHGHTPVPSGDRNALGVEGPQSPATILERAGWRVREPELEVPDSADHQAVVALQGAFAYVYLADRPGCAEPGRPCDWDEAPEPGTVDSVAALFAAAPSDGPQGSESSESSESSEGSEGSGAPGASERSGGLEMVLIPRRDDAGTLTGIDRWTPEGPAALETTSVDTAFIDFEERLLALLEGPAGHLAGDLVLVARSGAWVPRDERHYYSHPYHSWHGSAHASDSRAPLLLARSGADGAEVESRLGELLPEAAGQTDVARLLLDLLEVDAATGARAER